MTTTLLYYINLQYRGTQGVLPNYNYIQVTL